MGRDCDTGVILRRLLGMEKKQVKKLTGEAKTKEQTAKLLIRFRGKRVIRRFPYLKDLFFFFSQQRDTVSSR